MTVPYGSVYCFLITFAGVWLSLEAATANVDKKARTGIHMFVRAKKVNIRENYKSISFYNASLDVLLFA